MILPVYQPLGSSSHRLAQFIGKIYGEKATHTGTLDPMAEGVLVVLTGSDRFKKQTINTGTKKYKFSVVLGISTDTHDLLGLITNSVCLRKNDLLNRNYWVDQAQKWAKSILGKYEQTIPSFSAKRLAGKSLFELSSQGILTPKIQEHVHIFKLECKSATWIQGDECFEQTLKKISQVRSHNFRSKKIEVGWKQLRNTFLETSLNLKQQKIPFFNLNFEVEVSKRTYIRGLVADLAIHLGIPLVTSEIIRVENNGFHILDCLCYPPLENF